VKYLLLALALAGLAQPVRAETLGSFTSERPQPWEAGALRNVSLAAALVNGTVLAPGASFSFNKAMEARLGDFVEGTSFLGGREVKSLGGGICQVSTGLYNAALLSGLEVLERNGHSLYDPREAYAPPGRDAMVSREGGSDFRFRNSTASPLTIQASAEGGRLSVTLLGRQRHPRSRWIETVLLDRETKNVLTVPDPDLEPGSCAQAGQGFDGLKVSTRVCWKGPGGRTEHAALGVDHYVRVDERWRVGSQPSQP